MGYKRKHKTKKNDKPPNLEIMLNHFISGPQHCVGVQSYIILPLASLKTNIHLG
jgi:hypothetical protein